MLWTKGRHRMLCFVPGATKEFFESESTISKLSLSYETIVISSRPMSGERTFQLPKQFTSVLAQERRVLSLLTREAPDDSW